MFGTVGGIGFPGMEELHFEVRDNNDKTTTFTRHTDQQQGTDFTGLTRA
jgi:hypothetical protein